MVLHKRWSFPLKISSVNLVIFTEEILNGKLHFLYSAMVIGVLFHLFQNMRNFNSNINLSKILVLDSHILLAYSYNRFTFNQIFRDSLIRLKFLKIKSWISCDGLAWLHLLYCPFSIFIVSGISGMTKCDERNGLSRILYISMKLKIQANRYSFLLAASHSWLAY